MLKSRAEADNGLLVTSLPSIRSRLSSVLVGFALAWGVAVSAAVGLVVQREVDALLDNALQESAEVLLGLMTINAAQLPLARGGAMQAPLHDEQLVWQIVSARSQVLLRSHRAPDGPLAAKPRLGLSTQGADWHVFGLAFGAKGDMLYVAQTGEGRREAKLLTVGFAVAAALAVGLFGVVLLRTQVRRELQPIITLSAAVEQFDPLLDDATLGAPTRAELLPLHHAVTGLGSRLARHVATERAFAAHAAHALRTPLASMAANLAVAQRRAAPQEQEHLKRTRESADRLRSVVNALLTMFRSGGEARRQHVHLGDLLAQLPFDELELDADDEAAVDVDPDLLAAALMNLLDNAQRHGARRVGISVMDRAGMAILQLQDDGSGIDAERLAQLQSAMDKQDYDGHTGLGLMLADLVARTHGGRLRLLPATAGCRVELSLGQQDAKIMPVAVHTDTAGKRGQR
jgi:two-component system OmpR family sensor kinase